MKVKNDLVKFAAVIIGVILLFEIPLYAAEEKPMLEVETAVKAAIAHSNEMDIKNNSFEALKEKSKLDNSMTYYQYQTTYLKKIQNEQQREMLEDKIAADITTKYDTLIILNKEIDIIEKDLEICSKELLQMEVKRKKGLVNPVTFQSKQIEFNHLVSNKSAKEEELKNAQAYFQVLTGKDITQYRLNENITYEPFKIVGSIDGFFNSKIEKYLQYDKELAKLDEANLLEEGDRPIFYADYLTKKSAAEIQVLSLEEKQKVLKQSLLSSYTSLIDLERQINDVQSQLTVFDKELKSAELRYKQGLISVIDYKKQAAKNQEATVKRLGLINSYNSLKTTIQKPWAAIS